MPLFHSYINPGLTATYFSSNKNKEKVFKLQKNCLRLMTSSPYLAISNLPFSSVKTSKLDDIVNSYFLRPMYSFSNDNLSKQLDNFFQYLLIHITLELRSNST